MDGMRAGQDPPQAGRSTQAVDEGVSVAEMRSRLEAVWQLSNDALFAVGLDGIIVAWNAAAERIYGYPAEGIIGKHLSILVPEDRRHELSTTITSIGRGATVEGFETIRLRRDGVPIDVSLSIAPTRDESGQATGVLVVARDITAIHQALRQAEQSSVQLSDRERMLRRAIVALRKSHEEGKATQLQLVQAAKLESIGRLAAGVAHEVKNPLAVILFAIDYLAETIQAPDANMVTALNDARDAVVRADSVIRGLLEFSRATDLNPTPEDVNSLLERALALVRHALTKSHIFVVEEFASGLPQAMLDRNKIEQVFVNLMINAIDAMPSGGTLIVGTRREQLKDTGPDVGYRQSDRFRIGESAIVVSIEDTGTGINENVRERLFDPFFTTKAPGRGTGLGLAVCKSIIALHGGTIRIANRESGGARATVVFHSIRS
ncbi:MAG: PAS domain S-box protein [Candidatus Eisenbacteria bacterium]|uniref:histidine kinase n=1 Tax=Eiseniibacteriota bacterium TaxID=2212470 RepID=A0A538T542_UNCEI|nr:MAG: PAS domain S-box protein [Candidatus Eisenbacteria bacterium]